MSDPKYGEPVEETTPDAARPAVDDVVGSANAGLAEAEAAGDRDFSFSDRGSDLSLDYERYTESTASESSAPDATAPAATAVVPPAAASAAVASEPLSRREADERTRAVETPTADDAAIRDEDRAATTRVDTTPPATVAADEPAVAPAMQPIFVQAPEAPRPRGNRGAVAAIGLLAALVFAVVLLVASLLLIVVSDGMPDVAQLGESALAVLMTAEFWVPVAVFYLAFCILGAFINRGRWGLWVIFGLLVGLASYGGHILGALVAAPFWTLTASQGVAIVGEELFAPLALVALVAGREITIWFGAWVAARGRRVTELNAEAQREYERTLEAGPQLHRS